MKYIAAYALAVLAGKTSPSKTSQSEDDIKKTLQEVGCEVNGEELSKVVNALKGKALHELIAAGSKKLANVSFGSGSGASTQAAGSTTQQAPAKEEKKPEPKKEEEADVGLGGDLFGDEW